MTRTCPTAAIVVLAAQAALAGTPADEARRLFERGNRDLKDGDYVTALDDYRAAYALSPNPKILLNTGTVLRQLGRAAEAYEAYEGYLGGAGADATNRREVAALLDELDARLGRLVVTVDPPGRVFVDGRSVADGKPVAAVTVRVESGLHTVVAETQRGVLAQLASVSATAERPVELRGARPFATSMEEPAAVTAPTAPPPAPSVIAAQPARGRFGALGRTAVDVAGGGAVVGLGLSFALTSRLELAAMQLAGGSAKGAYLGASWRFGQASLAPFIAAGVPVFVVDGPRPGVRGAGGLSWEPVRFLAVTLELGGEYFPTAAAGIARTLLVPAVGLGVRL